MDVKKSLFGLGLKEPEINMYLAGLEIGDAPISQIAKKAGVKRGSAYLVAKNLEKKGLMGSFKTKSGLKFVSSSPRTLSVQAKRNSQAIEKVLPELEAVEKKLFTKSNITVFKDRKGYLAVFEDSINVHGGTICAIGSLDKFYEVISYEYDNEHYIPTRVKRRIKFKGLYFEDEATARFSKKRDAEELREMRFMPQKYYQPSFSLIYRDTLVIFTSKKELMAVKIVSEDIVKSEQAKFDLLWDLTGKK